MNWQNLPIIRAIRGDYSHSIFLLLAAVILFICLNTAKPIPSSIILALLITILIALVHVS